MTSLNTKVFFHPGCPGYAVPATSGKRKAKRTIRTTKPTKKPQALLPIESIPEEYRIQYVMHTYSIPDTLCRTLESTVLIKLYEDTEILRPYLSSVKQAHHRMQGWSFRNQFLRTVFKRLAQLWLYKRYRGRYLNTIDVATLEEPKKAIEVYNAKAKGTYVFEAASIRRSIQDDLSFTDWLFPDPQLPKNPWTNCPFTTAQLIRIMHELYRYQMSSHFLESFRACKWDLLEYSVRYKVPIKIDGLKNMIRNKTSEEYTELICEFIEDEFEYHDIEFASHLIILKWAAVHTPTDPYMAHWATQFESYHRICILNGSRVLDRADDIFDTMHNITYVLLRKNSQIARLGRMRLMVIPRRSARN